MNGGPLVNPSRVKGSPSRPSNLSASVCPVQLHGLVKESGRLNFEGLRIPVPSRLNIAEWRSLLTHFQYDDLIICDFLEFGWPVGFVEGSPLNMLKNSGVNHKGATQFPGAIHDFIREEREEGATVGPFKLNPFPGHMQISPLNTVPKDESDRRIIMDLSFPHGASTNDGIPKKEYLGSPVELAYPSIDTLVGYVWEKGRGSLLFKRDLRRAYRQLPVDPSSYPLLGF